ncbi:EF-hand domain-containing protein, partial [Salmonella sp. s51933]
EDDLLNEMRKRMESDASLCQVDYEQMGVKLSTVSDMTEQQSEQMRKDFLKVSHLIGLKPGTKVPTKEETLKAGESLIAMVIDEQKVALTACGMMYDLIDTDDDGYISITDFKAFLQVLATDITDEKAVRCFNTLDFNGDGQISRGEFFISSHEFMHRLKKKD